MRRLPLAEVSRHFTGIALELSPEADFRPGVERQTVGLRQLLGRVSGLKRSLTQIFLLAFALEAFMLLSPFYLQWVVDGVLVSNDRDLLVTLGIGFALLVLIQVGAGAIRSWAVLHLSSTLNLQWLNASPPMRLPVTLTGATPVMPGRASAPFRHPADAMTKLVGCTGRPSGGDSGNDARSAAP